MKEREFQFTSILSDYDVNLIDKNFYYSQVKTAKINWKLQFDLNDFGIRCMTPVIESIKLNYTSVNLEDETSNTKEFELYIVNIDKYKVNIIKSNSFEHLYPTSIKIDFNKMRIDLNFKLKKRSI